MSLSQTEAATICVYASFANTPHRQCFVPVFLPLCHTARAVSSTLSHFDDHCCCCCCVKLNNDSKRFEMPYSNNYKPMRCASAAHRSFQRQYHRTHTHIHTATFRHVRRKWRKKTTSRIRTSYRNDNFN